MLGGVTRHMLPHLPGVPHLHVNRPLTNTVQIYSDFVKSDSEFLWFIFVVYYLQDRFVHLRSNPLLLKFLQLLLL